MSELPPMATTASGDTGGPSLLSTESEFANFIRGQWHVVNPGAKRRQRVLDGRRHHGGHGNAACLARALHPQRVDRRWSLDVIYLQERHLGCIGHEKIHVAAVEQLAILVIVHMLVE